MDLAEPAAVKWSPTLTEIHFTVGGFVDALLLKEKLSELSLMFKNVSYIILDRNKAWQFIVNSSQ